MESDMQGNTNEKVGKSHPPKHTRWKPGQSGNPKGRPKNTVYLSEMLREQLDQVPETIDGEPNTRTWRDLICDSILRAAVMGSQPAITKELLDRIEGKVTIPVGGTADNVIIEVVYADRPKELLGKEELLLEEGHAEG